MPLRALPHHAVLPGADGRSYHSVQIRPISRAQRFALGRELRQQLPRASLGQWQPDKHRPDPIAQIVHSHDGRLASLIPIRVGRMAASPYGFLRGATVVMAHDFSRLQATGITPVICGDAHLGNFGFYASPERDLVIDLNDFDEAHPGPWEWDLRRLVVSLWIAGRQNGTTEARCGDAVMACVASYREIHPVPFEPAIAVALLSAAERRPAAHDGEGEIAPRRNCAGGSGGADQDQRSQPAEVYHCRRRGTTDRRSPTADHARDRQAGEADRAGPSTTISSRWHPTGGVLSPVTRWSMWRTKSLASAASACAATSRCSRGAAPTMSSSCS